ncbi:MAG: DNA topoisomerase VI subunit B [Candidatus Aenigmarchaeota archaeon]|nr:DNA topoisomerase VI subunit B [Candidatus Aenigmarchaeota archaeon]
MSDKTADRVERVRSAEDLSRDQREISISEFFEKNRHLLGYDNKVKALLTVVREAVDNSLDACETARIVPDIKVSVKLVSGMKDRYVISVEDNGPGIVKQNIGRVFGKLLFGSKFHKLLQSRGQQGIGISGAVLYSQLTSGKPAKIVTSTGDGKTHCMDLMIDTFKNEPEIIKEDVREGKNWHGVKIELEAEGKYVEHQQSISEYLKQTALSNPYAEIIYDSPDGKIKFERSVKTLPEEPKSIKPHPHGVEIGILRRMLRTTEARTLTGFFTTDFSRVGQSSAKEIIRLAKFGEDVNPKNIDGPQVEKLFQAVQQVQLIKPPLDCLSPLREKLIEEGLKKQLKPEYVVAITRPPDVYRGNPFQIEVGVAYGGELPPDSVAALYRFANRVPLMYQAGDCALAKAVSEIEWRRYGLEQASGAALPTGPIAIFVHIASVWVPFTSESKEAIASYPEIIKEVKLALQEAGRKLSIYVNKKRRAGEAALRMSLFEKYIPEVADALARLSGAEKGKIAAKLENMLKKGKVVIEDTEEPEKPAGKEDDA